MDDLHGLCNKRIAELTAQRDEARAELAAATAELKAMAWAMRIMAQMAERHGAPPGPSCPSGTWTCLRCHSSVPPANVTYEETHDGCGGRCV